MSNEKTALELVGRATANIGHGYNVSIGCMRDIKAAIERERDAMMADIQRLQVAIGQNQAEFDRTIQEMNDSQKSASTMRPISELPDRVPTGCFVVAVSAAEAWVWERGINPQKAHEASTVKALGFYIVPIPPDPDGALKPCPFCGERPQRERNCYKVIHMAACPIYHATIINFRDADAWGRE